MLHLSVMKEKLLTLLRPSFLVFLVIATLLWCANKLGGNYQAQLKLIVEVRNDFSAQVWIAQSEIAVQCRVEGDGTSLMSHLMGAGRHLVVPMSELQLLPAAGEGNYKVEKLSLVAALDRAVKELRVVSVLDSAIHIRVSPIEGRRMAVRSRIHVQPSGQYMQIGTVEFTPDSVEVRGPKVLLDSIGGIWTRDKSYAGIKGSVGGTIELQKPRGIMISPEQVSYAVQVLPYTQSVVELSVRVLHLPDSLQSMTVPAAVRVVVNVPLRDYDRVRLGGLTAAVDYRQALRERGKRCVVQIDSLPDGAEVVRVEPQFVEPFFMKR